MLPTDMGVHAGGSRVGSVLHLPPGCLQDFNVFTNFFHCFLKVEVFIVA